MMLLWLASTATVGSFCLFCENGNGGLALVTFTETSAAAWAASGLPTITRAAADPSTSSIFKGFLKTLSLSALSAPPGEAGQTCTPSNSAHAAHPALQEHKPHGVKRPRPGSRYAHQKPDLARL